MQTWKRVDRRTLLTVRLPLLGRESECYVIAGRGNALTSTRRSRPDPYTELEDFGQFLDDSINVLLGSFCTGVAV